MLLNDVFKIAGEDGTIPQCITLVAANSKYAVLIPANYTGTESFTNPNDVPILDLRAAAVSTGLGGPLAVAGATNFNQLQGQATQAQLATPTPNWFNVKAFGAVGDARQVTLTTNGTTTLQSSGAFLPSDVGKKVFGVSSTGLNSQPLATITGYTDASHVTVSVAAGTTTSGVAGWIGTDDTAAINTAFNAAVAAQGTCYIPVANYMVTSAILTYTGTNYITVRGDGMNLSRFVFPPFSFTSNFIQINDPNATYQDFSVDDLLTVGAVVSTSNGQFVTMNAGQCYRVRLKDWNGTGTGGTMFYLTLDNINLTEIETNNCNVGVFNAASGLKIFRPILKGTVGFQNFDVDCVIFGGKIGGATPILCQVQGSSGQASFIGCDIYASTTSGGSSVNVAASAGNIITFIDCTFGLSNFTPSGANNTSLTVGAGAIVYLLNNIMSQTGTGACINNAGTVVDMGGNSFLGTGTTQTGAGSTIQSFLNSTATSATAGSNGAVPSQVAGYLIVSINGTNQKIPYFAV